MIAAARARPGIWPRSLAARTALVLLLGLALVQAAGLTIHALDRMELQHMAATRNAAIRMVSLFRTLELAGPRRRGLLLQELSEEGLAATVGPAPSAELPELPPALQRAVRSATWLVPMPREERPREMVLRGDRRQRLAMALRFPEGDWLNVQARIPPARPWHSPNFLIAFLLMSAAAAGLTLWAVRRLTAPVATLAAAAERLGRDVDAPPLPEDGPTEVAQAAAAFNLMAARIRRFVQDRVFLLTAIGHDLRTPITRLKLRAEFLDDEMRGKFLADLDELETMVAATLAFGRDATAGEPVTALDLAALARTVLDEAADAWPEKAEALRYEGPAHLTVRARSVALKRALANLVANAVKYGGSARVRLVPPVAGMVSVRVEDEGPGIAPAELDRVFEPFQRGEASRNRETGGVGLGLSIARNILRAHGGDVTLANRPMGGVCATVVLPA